MFDDIRADMMRIIRKEQGRRNMNFLWLLWENYGFQALLIYRYGRWLAGLGKRRYGGLVAAFLQPTYRLLSACARKAYGIDLDQSAEIGPGFYINHFGGIEVRNCRIGPQCNIQQQVKLGSPELTGNKLLIGEAVYIGAHARICAAVNIGDGASIGAGSVITEDIPARCLVLGNPARIAQRDYDNRAVL